MSCCDIENCNLLSHCVASLSAANAASNGGQEDTNVEVEFESASSEHLHLIVKFLNNWKQRRCLCLIRRSGHHSLIAILFMLTTKSLVEEIEKLCAIFLSLADGVQTGSANSSVAAASDDTTGEVGQSSSNSSESSQRVSERRDETSCDDLTAKTVSRPSTPLVTEEVEDLLRAVEVIFNQEFLLSNHYLNNKTNILSRVLKNLLFKQRFMTSVTECLKSATPKFLPLSFVHLIIKLTSSVLRCVSQETVKSSDEFRFVSVSQRAEVRSAIVHYMQQLSEDDLRNPKARQAVEFCWDRIQELSLDTIDSDCLDLALKYIKSSTLTMRLSGLAFINQQVGICERKQPRGHSAGGGSLSPHSQQRLVASKSTFKRWLRNQQMVSVLFGASTHVELVRQCHAILQFMASGQLLTEADIDALWAAVNDKYKNREVIAAIEGILHHLNEDLLERFKEHLREQSIHNHSEQTFSLSCHITKVSWRRQLMTLNLAHQFGSILASKRNKSVSAVTPNASGVGQSSGGVGGAGVSSDGQQGSSGGNAGGPNSSSAFKQFKTIKDPSHPAVAVENMSNSDSEPQYPQNAVVKPDMDSPVLLSPKGAARGAGCARKVEDAEFEVPVEWKSGEDDVKGASSKDEDSGAGGSKQSNQSPPQLKPVQHKLRKKKQTTAAADFITGSSSEEEQVLLKFPNTGDHRDNPSKFVAPKRRRLDRKCVKHVDTAIPPPPPPPLPINVNTMQHSPVLANAKEYMAAHGRQVMDPCSVNVDKESRMRTNIEKLEKIVADASLDIFCEENQENVLQETDDLFRGIRDSKNDFGLDTQLQVDVNTGMVNNPLDGNGNRMPLLAAENVETGSQFSATGRRNSEPEDLPDPDGENSTQDDIGIEDEDVEEEDDEDDVEDLDDVDDDDDMSASAGLYCDQMIIRQLLQHEKILKPVTFRPAGVQTSIHQASTLSVDTSADATAGSASNRETQSEASVQKGAALAAVLKSASGKGRRNSSKGQASGSSSKSQRRSSDALNDNDEDNLEVHVITEGDGEYGDGGDTTDSAESSSSSPSSTNSLSSTSIFIKKGNSLIWDLLTSGQLSQLSPEQQECVKQNLFDLVAVFLKYPEILKEMVQSLLNSIYQHCSTITCVKMLQALFSNVMSLSSYAIQTHAMLDILVRNLVNLVQTNNSAGVPMLIVDEQSDEGVHEINSVVGLMPSLSQAELGEFLHLFESIFHKTNHGVCYTFSDEHVITLWNILSNNSHYKDFFLNWLCGICQTEEIHIMTEQQWLMIYCKLVLNDKQWAKIHGHNVSGYLSVSTESMSEGVSPLQQTTPTARELEVFTSALQATSPTLSDLSEVHLLAVLFCKAVKGTFFEEQQPTPSGDSRNSCDSINTETDSMVEASSFNAEVATNIFPTESANELINDGLRQFWKILLTSNDSDMQKMSRDVLNGYYLHLPELSKEHEFIMATSERITKFLKTTDTEKLSKLRELQSIVCLLLHHIQQSYKKYAFHIRLSALKQGSAPIHSHSKTWMPRKGAHQLKLYLARRTGMSQSKVITMQSSDYLGELRAEVAYHQMEEVLKSNASVSDMAAIEAADALDSTKLKYHRMLTNGLELKLEHDDRTLSDLCVRDESQIATVLTFLQCEDVNSDSSSKFQLGDVFLKFPGCLYVEPPLENYPQVILLQEAHFNQLFHLLRCLSNLKSVANKAQTFNVDEIIRLVWDLIMLLPTYPPIQEQFEILSTEKECPATTKRGDLSDPSIDWSTVLDVDNVFKLLYSLQMLEHLATNCHNKSSQLATTDSALTPRGFGGHGASLLTPTVTTVTSFEPLCNSETSESPSAATPNANSSDWCKKFVEYGGLKFLINVFESKILLHDSSCSTVQWSEWKQECLASILRLFYIFSTHPYTSGGLTLRSQPSFVGDSLSVSQSEIFIAPVESRSGNGKVSGDGSFISMLDQQIFLDSLLTIMNSASKAQTDSISRRTLSLKSNLVCQCFRILNLCACHDASVCTIFMNHSMFSSLIYQLVVNFATKNISKTASSGLAKLAQKSFEFCKKTIQQLIEFLSEVKSISESNFEECGNRDSRDSSVVADASCGQEYFALFENLMRIYLEKEEERVDDEEFVLYLVQSVRAALNEFFENSFWTEENGECSSLRGLLTIMCSICRLKPPFVTSEQGLELIMTLIECLFRIENETKTPRFVNPDTRKAAFDLIIQLASGSVSNYNFIYDTLMQQNSKESHAPYPWSYWPLDERRSDAGFVGLINLGATCYMATALQHLFMIHEARSAILCAGHTASEKGANKPGQGSKQDSLDGGNVGSNGAHNPERKHQKILLELQKMFAYLQLSDRKAYNPRSFCRSYVMDNEPLNTCDQKDMTEFFNDLIGKLEDMSPKLRDLVHNLFRGEITNSVVSLDCNHVSKTVEEFYTVRCQVADLRDLYESFDEFCQIDMLEGDNMYTCSSCQTKVRAEKRASFKKLPRILVINTMRYKFNMESMAREKVNTHFSFPTHLNMGKYTEMYLVGDSSRCNISAASGGAAAAASSSVDCSQQEELNYELIGVTVHTGAAESGHYYCFIRDRSYPQSDVWFLFNDSEVKPFNPDNIPQECFGGQMVSKTFNQLTEKFVDYAFEKSHSAYMLFYERSIDLMRGEDKTSLLQSNLNPPKLFSDAINADNLQLRHDRTLFDKNYFEFLYKFNDVVAKTLPTPGDSKSAVHFDLQRAKLSTTFVLETLVHSRESPSINFWLDFLSSLYSDCVEVCKWLVRHLAHNDWWLNQVLVRCSSAHIRALFQKLIFLAISTVCNKTSEEEWQLFCKNDFRQFLKTYINFTNSSILKRRHLKHFFEYCTLLMDIAKMGKQEALILISVGTIGHIVKFFLDVKLQKNQPANANGTSDDEELENGNGENDIISSAALEFDALNELLSFTTDGKKKSAVFHNIVELLEILLDKACSSSGASTMRDFQSLTRCLTDVDHAALTSNSFEFLKVLIEEEINLDSVSSILQMLIRMNKSFENFIPVRFCELILAAGSPEIVKPYFRVLAKLETQLHPLSVTQHIIKYIPKLLQWCPRPTLGLLKDCARSVHVTTWALQNLDVWVKQFLIAENNYRVRFEAAEILMMLVPDHGQLYNHWKSNVDKFNVNEKHSFDHDEAALAVIHKILKHLLNMLEEFPSLSMGTYRFQYYFTVMTALTTSVVEKKMFTPYFPQLWAVFYPHLIHSKVESCVNKQALLLYWYWVCVDCPQNVNIIVANKAVLKNIFFNYILVNHEDRDLIAFNKQCLQTFFGLIRLCCECSVSFCLHFMRHENFQWALENVFPSYNLYPKASNELLKIMEILLSYLDASMNNEAVGTSSSVLRSSVSVGFGSSASCSSDLTNDEKEEVAAFKKKLIFQFTKCLNRRGLWISVSRIYSVLLQTEEDYVCFVCEAPGLRLLTEALLASFEAPHHVPIFHGSTVNSAALSANAATVGGINSRADLVNLLTKVIRNYRQYLETSASTGPGPSSSASSSLHTPEKVVAKPQWKNCSHVCEKLLSLLNSTHSLERRNESIACLKEIISTFPTEAAAPIVEVMHAVHSSCERKKCSSTPPGIFFPRAMNSKQQSASLGNETGRGNGNQMSGGILGFAAGGNSGSATCAMRKYELAMCLHPEHLTSEWNVDKTYEEEVRSYYTPYYNNVAQPVLNISIQRGNITPKLAELICYLTLDTLRLRLDWMARLLMEYYNKQELTTLLCNSTLFAQVFNHILSENRAALNIMIVFSFCTSYTPKLKELTLEQKNTHLHAVVSFFISQSYHLKLGVDTSNTNTPSIAKQSQPLLLQQPPVESSDSLSPNTAKLQLKPNSNNTHTSESITQEMNGNLKAMQLLLTCCNAGANIDVVTLKNSLNVLHAKLLSIKCGGDVRKDMSSSDCNLPPKKIKLGPSESCVVSDIRSKIGKDIMECSSSALQPDNQQERASIEPMMITTSVNIAADLKSSETGPLAPQPGSSSSVLGSPSGKAQPVYSPALLKTLSSTLAYLKQYEERCNIQN